MNGSPDNQVFLEYSSALENYLSGGSEEMLERAYEIGRRGMEQRMGILELAEIHSQSLQAVARHDAEKGEGTQLVKMATDFLIEAFAPFEMTQRGYMEALDELKGMNQMLEQQVAERTGALRSEIDERKHVEAELRKSQEKYRQVVDNVHDIIYSGRAGKQHRGLFQLIFVSPQVQPALGHSPAELQADPDLWLLAVHHDDIEDLIRVRSAVLSGGERHRLLYRIKNRETGDVRWMEDDIIPQKDAAGHVFAFFGVARDVTDRQLALENIERQLARVKALRSIDVAILGATDLNLVLRTVLNETRAQLGADAVFISLFNQQALSLDLAASVGFHSEAAKATEWQITEGGILDKAILDRKLVAMPELDTAALSEDEGGMMLAEGIKSLYAAPLVAKGHVLGMMGAVFRRPFEAGRDWIDFFEMLGGQAAVAIDSARVFEDLQHTNLDLVLAYDKTIEGWSRALDLRDKETEGHTLRVTELTIELARRAGLRRNELADIRRGALLHDIGKMGIPDAILLKPASLTDGEMATMRQHLELAYYMLSPITYLRSAIDIPYCHHEKWNGTGYPRCLKGEQIPVSARLFAVVDVWDALSSDRPYRQRWPKKRVLEYIHSQAGSHFDGEAVEMFLQVIEDKSAAEMHQDF